MSNYLKRNHSRRRLAAVTFLANISLDGSYKDTKLSCILNNKKNDTNPPKETQFKEAKMAAEEEEESEEGPDDCFSSDTAKIRLRVKSDRPRKRLQKFRMSSGKSPDIHSLSSDSESVVTPAKGLRSEDVALFKNVGQSGAPFRDRAATSGSESLAERNGMSSCNRSKQRVTNQGSVSSDTERHGGHASSSESLGSIPALRSRASTVVPKQVRIVNASKTKSMRFNDERIIMVSANFVPFFVCSFIPYARNPRHVSRSEVRKEGNRRSRNTSGGARPLSSIGDGGDPFDLFGLERGLDGQEVSYGQLLVPTRIREECAEVSPGRNRHIVARYC